MREIWKKNSYIARFSDKPRSTVDTGIRNIQTVVQVRGNQVKPVVDDNVNEISIFSYY